MKRNIMTTVALTCALVLGSVSAEWLSTGGRHGAPEVEILRQSALGTVFEVTVPGIEASTIEADGRTYRRLTLPGEVFAALDEGRPEVPKVSVLLGIPTGADVAVRVTVLESMRLEVAEVYPLQPPLLDGEEPGPTVRAGDFYTRDIVYPEVDARGLEPGVWRDLHVVNVEVYPVRVNPGRGEVTVATRMRIEVDYSGGSYPDRASDWLLPQYAEYIDNFEQLGIKPELDYSAGTRYLVICHNNYAAHSMLHDSLLGWVKQRGYDVRVITKASFTASEIKDSIRNEYNRNNPHLLRWVLLVGEYAEVPMGSYSGVTYSDFWYSDLEPWPSGDNYPEIGIARLSPASATDLNNQVRKILKYQKNPPATNNWLDRLTMVANYQDYPGKYSGCVRGIHRMPKPYWNPTLDTIMGQFHTSNAPIFNAINSGVGILPYRGHGSSTQWWRWTPLPSGIHWDNADISALSNGDLTPVVYNIACSNGEIFQPTCLSEQWMRKYPGGAAASLAATQASYTYPNHGICSTLVRAACDTWTITVPGVRNYAGPVFDIGGVMMYMDAYVAKYWPSSVYPRNIWMYLMLGDPSMPVWSGGMPQAATVTCPDTIAPGSMNLNVLVQVGGRPVEGAIVCAWKGSEVYIAERTGPTGTATLAVNPTTEGQMVLTVSEGHAQHSIPGVAHTPILPYVKQMTVRQANRPDVGATHILVPAGTLDSGTVVTPACSVYNYGTTTATYQVRMRVAPGYSRTVTVSAHVPGTRRYAAFPNWTAAQRGTFAVTCSTELSGDSLLSNDRQVGSVTVRVRDIGVTRILLPPAVIDSGASITPACTVYNYGTVTENYTVMMRIGTFYVLGGSVSNHAPGTRRYVTFPARTITQAGSLAVTCSTRLGGDVVQSNNKVTGSTYSRVRNIAALSIIAPSGTVDSGTGVIPRASVRNLGNTTVTFPAVFRVSDGYADTVTVSNLAAGATDTIPFSQWTASQREALSTSCSTMLSGDVISSNNRTTGTVTVRVIDAQAVSILAPTGTVDSGYSAAPQATVRNNGTSTASFPVIFRVSDGYEDTAQVTSLAVGAQTTVTFGTWTATRRGGFTTACTTRLTDDMVNFNDKAEGTVLVQVQDVGVVTCAVPVNGGAYVVGDSIQPEATWRNYGSQNATFEAWMLADDPTDGRMYAEKVDVADLAPGSGIAIDAFSVLVLLAEGDWTYRCSTYMADDVIADNDLIDGRFLVAPPRPPWPEGWVEVARMPGPTPVKRGGWLAANEDNGMVYGGKGNKTFEFYGYEAVGDTWTRLADIPTGTIYPDKGACGDADDDNQVYYVRGKNTLDFLHYIISRDSWYELPDVPEGLSGKRIKGGTDMTFVPGVANGYVYLLKGYKDEFYKYDTLERRWIELPPAPTGLKLKWNKGSWIVYDGDATIYAHKAKYYDRVTYKHEFWKFDIRGDTWYTTQLAGMPLYGMHSGRIKKKKAKDGGAADYFNGAVYALKGGNTQQFWKYDVAGDTWIEQDTIPTCGSTGRKKRVKYGGDFTHWGLGAFFALKGNKTLEMWRYVLPAAMASQPERSGVMGGVAKAGRLGVTLAPNPLTGGFATLRYSLPMAGPATIHVFDVTGRSVVKRTVTATRTGTVSLDVRNLSAGIYLVRLDTDGYTATQKLVVQK